MITARRAGRGLATLVLLLAAGTAAAGTVNRCTGPGGEILYTDRECPPGHRAEGDPGAGRERTDREPYFCESPGSLGPYEVESAIAVAEGGLAAAARQPEGADRAASWRTCLERLRERRRALAAADAVTPPAAAPPPQRAETASPCRNGSFGTENGFTSIEVSFTNRGSAPCRGVDAYCLFHLFTGGPGDYRESGVVHYEGTVRPGETVRIGEVASQGGPAGRSIAWSWCRFR